MKLVITAEVRVDDIVAHASPTDTLRLDLTKDLGGTPSVSVIDKAVLVDTADNERDSVSISPTDWLGTSFTGGYQYICNKEIRITGNYNVTKVRLYAGTKLYFEYVLTESYQVKSGMLLLVKILIKCMFTASHSGSVSGTISRLEDLANTILKRILLGEDIGATWENVFGMYNYVNQFNVTVTITVDETNYKITVTASFTPDQDWLINGYAYHSSVFGYTPHVSIPDTVLASNVTHSWRLEVQI